MATAAKALVAPSGWKISPAQWKELGVPIAVLCVVIALITPIPGFLLDILVVTDITMSTIIMMVSMYIRKPTEFSARTADSRPGPGPLIRTSRFFTPHS